MTNTNVTNETTWHKSSNMYFPSNATDTYSTLDAGVYNIGLHPMRGPFLEWTADRLTVPTKLYDLQSEFMNRVLISYKQKNQVGVLLHGLKGTSKSVTAKQLANTLADEGVIIILANCSFKGISDFLEQIHQPAVVLFDEFEKNFNEKNDNQNEFLSLFDGTTTSNVKRLYILTANKLAINDNLINRPSRILYMKEFNNLEPEIVQMIADDLLNNKENVNEVVSTISRFKIITIDIVMQFINECNIHTSTSPQDLVKDFNIETYSNKYTAVLEELIIDDEGKFVLSGKKRVIKNVINIHPGIYSLKQYGCIGDDLCLNYQTIGEIAEKRTFNDFVIKSDRDQLFTEEEYIKLTRDNDAYHRQTRANEGRSKEDQIEITATYTELNEEGNYFYRVTLQLQPPMFVDPSLTNTKLFGLKAIDF